MIKPINRNFNEEEKFLANKKNTDNTKTQSRK